MFDWLRYFPLSLGFKQTYDYVVPKGPYFSALKQLGWRFGDSEFSFSAPSTNRVWGNSRYARKAAVRNFAMSKDVLKLSLENYSPSFMPTLSWQYNRFFVREWIFVGPWFSGEKASLSMFIEVVGKSQDHQFEGSFFHPRVFESAVSDWLDAYYGYRKSGSKAAFGGPVDWRILDISDTVKSVRFEIQKIEASKENPKIYQHVMMPIAHDRFINISFNFSGLRRVEKYLDTTPVFELCDSIINSFKLKIGPATLSERNKVANTCPDMDVTPEFGELQWPTKKYPNRGKSKTQENERDITNQKDKSVPKLEKQ